MMSLIENAKPYCGEGWTVSQMDTVQECIEARNICLLVGCDYVWHINHVLCHGDGFPGTFGDQDVVSLIFL